MDYASSIGLFVKLIAISQLSLTFFSIHYRSIATYVIFEIRSKNLTFSGIFSVDYYSIDKLYKPLLNFYLWYRLWHFEKQDIFVILSMYDMSDQFHFYHSWGFLENGNLQKSDVTLTYCKVGASQIGDMTNFFPFLVNLKKMKAF